MNEIQRTREYDELFYLNTDLYHALQKARVATKEKLMEMKLVKNLTFLTGRDFFYEDHPHEEFVRLEVRVTWWLGHDDHSHTPEICDVLRETFRHHLKAAEVQTMSGVYEWEGASVRVVMFLNRE